MHACRSARRGRHARHGERRLDGFSTARAFKGNDPPEGGSTGRGRGFGGRPTGERTFATLRINPLDKAVNSSFRRKIGFGGRGQRRDAPLRRGRVGGGDGTRGAPARPAGAYPLSVSPRGGKGGGEAVSKQGARASETTPGQPQGLPLRGWSVPPARVVQRFLGERGGRPHRAAPRRRAWRRVPSFSFPQRPPQGKAGGAARLQMRSAGPGDRPGATTRVAPTGTIRAASTPVPRRRIMGLHR